MSGIKLIECPRDAMQGIHHFIDTSLKAEYINLLLQVGFDTIDFGSFVSEKAIPQLKDTSSVLSMLNVAESKSKLLAIVANVRGAEEAILHEDISYLGFPFSLSETFQKRNTNSSIEESMQTVERMLELCSLSGKEAVIYLSMGFGNPYGDPWNEGIVAHWSSRLVRAGATILSLSDTTGVSSPEKIDLLLRPLLRDFSDVEIGVHLHSTPDTRLEKLEAAYGAGCRRFDSALKGYGGCPMASDELTGNMATEDLISYLSAKGEPLNLNMEKWQEAVSFSQRVFL
ncbi:MAG: hydroxymethylglutaryl-CoA lyase [Pedobacter sp.]|nr:MAG: hydroxymethylglutaryl-CoA lyase [Pedobacter sp.]